MMRVLVLSLLLLASPAAAQDMLLFNAKGYTQQYGALAPFDALLVKDGRVQAVGTREILQPYAANAVQRDLDGKTVLPGLVHAYDRLSALCGETETPALQTCVLDVLRARARDGFTLIQDTATTQAVWEVLARMRDTRTLPLRVYASINELGAFYNDVSRAGPNVGTYESLLSLRAISLSQQQGCTAPNVAAYNPAAQRNRIARGVLKGYQMRLSARSGEAFTATIGAYKDVISIAGTAGRHILAPRGDVDASLAPSMVDLGLVIPLGACGSVVEGLGPLADANVSVALASDAPFEAMAKIARSAAGSSIRSNAFFAATMGGAYAAFLEQVVGSLEPGKWADFIIVDQDIFSVEAAQISTTAVLETWVAGKQVFGATD